MKTVSLKSVIGKILRDTKMTDMSYIDDLQNWIPEAMDKMYIQRMVGLGVCIAKSDDQGRIGKPNGFRSVAAFVYQGSRVGVYTGAKHITKAKDPVPEKVAYVSTLVKEIVTTTDLREANFWTSQVIKNAEYGISTKKGYVDELNYLWFTEPNAEVELHYWYTPCDEDGFPLIPDDGYLVDAIYWYCRAKMIGTGHLDPVFGRDDRMCLARWEENAARAQRIDYPTIDEEQAKLANTLRLVFPVDLWENFNITDTENYL